MTVNCVVWNWCTDAHTFLDTMLAHFYEMAIRSAPALAVLVIYLQSREV